MQPKFTQRSLRSFCVKILAVALIFCGLTQISFGQKKSAKESLRIANVQNVFEKKNSDQALKALNLNADNDAGKPNFIPVGLPNNPQATCTTWTVSVDAPDPILPGNLRPFRDGIVKTCAAPGTCTTPSSTGTFHYQIFQWVCPVAQCVTVTYTATNANFSFVTVYSAPPSLPVSCANWVSDPGSSGTNGVPIVFSFNGTAGTTYYFLVNDVGVLPANCTISIDAAVCTLSPCSGTPAPGNTLASPNPVGPSQPFTLSLQNPPAGTGLNHQWQSSPNGSAPWTNIVGATSQTYVATQTTATYYRDSVRCTNSNLFGISTPILVTMGCGWSASTNYPIPILDQAVATVGNNMYSFSGVSNGVLVANSYKFDGTTWTAIAPFPIATEYPNVASDGTNVYIVGGVNSSNVYQTTLYRYNVAANTYTTLAPCTVGTWNHACAYLNGKIYKIAGFSPAGGVTNLEIYDIATNTWTAGAPYPAALGFVSAVAIGNYIYTAGGTDALGNESGKTYRYDPATNTWDDGSIADLPATRWGAASGAYLGRFIVAGGYSGGIIVNTALRWNPTNNTWSATPTMIGDRSRMNGSVLGGSFYVVGGRSTAVGGFTGTNNNQQLACQPPPPCSGTPGSLGNTLTSSTSSTLLPNGGFETGSLAPWVPLVSNPAPVVNTNSPRTGAYALFVGNAPGPEPNGDASIFQSFTVPAGGGSISFWYKGYTEDGINFDWQDAYITNAAGTTNLATIMHVCQTNASYVNVTYNLAAYAGQTIGIKFLVHQDGFGDVTNMYIDDVALLVQGNVVCSGELFTLSFQNPLPDETGYVIQWQRSSDNITYTDIAGANGATLTTSQTTPTWYRAKVTCTNSNQSVFSNPIQMLSGQGVFTSQPSNASVQCGSNTSFGFTATGKDLSYRWEYRTSSSSTTWLNVSNGGTAPGISGANTNTLSLTNIPSTWNGYQFRGLMEGPCTATDYTNIVTLTVTPLVAIVNPSSATICLGSVQRLTIGNQLSSPPPVTSSFTSGPISVAIPDNDQTGTSHTIPVTLPAGASIVNARVTINMTHTWDGDMVFVLKAPNGQILNLDYYLSNTGGTGPTTGFVNTVISSTGTAALSSGSNPYTGTFKADAVSNAFAGPLGSLPTTTTWSALYSTVNGNWTLGMYDGGPGDVGTLTSWSITFDYTQPTFANGIWTSNPASPNTMFLDAGANIPYAGTPEDTIYVKPSVNTVYTVVITTPTPCTSLPTNVPVNVTTPISNLTIPANKSVCVGDNTTITATANGGPITWQWQVSNNGGVTYTDISGATSATLTLNNVSQLMNNYRYRVVATASPCGTVTSAAFTLLTVNPLPTVNLTANPTQVMPGVTTFVTASSTPAAASYAWTLNGAPITGATTSSVFADVDKMGSYKVTVTDVNGCVRTSTELVISARDNPRLFIYPNPNNGQFQARLYTPAIYLYDVHIVTIYNSAGQILLTKTFPITSQYVRMDFDMRGYAAGVYTARVTHHFTGKPTTAQFVIQH